MCMLYVYAYMCTHIIQYIIHVYNILYMYMCLCVHILGTMYAYIQPLIY